MPAATEMELELATGERYRVLKIWEDGDTAGFRFAAPVDTARLLADAPDGMRKRAVRLRLELRATLHSGGHSGGAPRGIVFRDISQHGACVACDARLARDERVRLECDLLPPITAKVRWRREPLYGLIFEQTFRFDELARLTAPLRLAAPAPGRRTAFAAFPERP